MGIMDTFRRRNDDVAEAVANDTAIAGAPFRPHRAPAPVDHVARRIEEHRNEIDRQQRRIFAIQQARDTRVAELTSQIGEATLDYEKKVSDLREAIACEEATARNRISVRRQLVRSSEAALVPLEPNEASREAPMEDRLVPRPAADPIPITRHTDIRS